MRLGGPVRTVAAAGPLAVFLATPLIGWITASGGTDAVFVFLAVISLPSAILPAEFANYRHERSRLSPSRSNVILVIAMGLMTMSGSSLFIYAATVGETVGMTAPWLSAAFSGNALVGFIAARLKRGSGSGGSWLFGTALCAAAVGFSDRTPFILIALIMWGFCFWMATPRILQSIAAWSLAPDERVGDTQSAMAAGRALGPAIGGALIGAGTFGAVTTFSVVGLIAAGLIVIAVHHQRRGLTPPTST
jgi:predicted MFS family arabinose efflux permease